MFATLQRTPASLAEANEHTRRFLEIHGTDWDVECEVRQLEEPDFGK